MIWAQLKDGMLATRYTPEMIDLPDSLQALRKGTTTKSGNDPDPVETARSASKKTNKPRKPPGQHAITPSRLGKNIMIARHATEVPDSTSSRPVSRLSPSPSPSRWGNTPQSWGHTPLSVEENPWWSSSRGIAGGSRPMPDRPSTSECAARNRYALSSPQPTSRPATVMERGSSRRLSERLGIEDAPFSARQPRRRFAERTPSPPKLQGGGGSSSSRAPPAAANTAFVDAETVVTLAPEMLKKGVEILKLDQGPPSGKPEKSEQSSHPDRKSVV